MSPSLRSSDLIVRGTVWGDLALSDFLKGNFLNGETVSPGYQGHSAILQFPNPLGQEIYQEESALYFSESHTEEGVFAHRSFQSSCPILI